MLLMFFLCEYLHLIIASIHFCIFFMGGWLSLSFYSFLFPYFVSYNDVNFIFI
jgi:NADH:ubiquinone oxidoreductase subunit H